MSGRDGQKSINVSAAKFDQLKMILYTKNQMDRDLGPFYPTCRMICSLPVFITARGAPALLLLEWAVIYESTVLYDAPVATM